MKLKVHFLTKIWDWIENPDHQNVLLRKETMYSKKEYFSFISIETTHNINIDGVPEKEYYGCWQGSKFADSSLFLDG